MLKISFTKFTYYILHVDKQNWKKFLSPYASGQLSQKPQLMGGEATGTSACSHCPLGEPSFVQHANESVVKARSSSDRGAHGKGDSYACGRNRGRNSEAMNLKPASRRRGSSSS